MSGLKSQELALCCAVWVERIGRKGAEKNVTVMSALITTSSCSEEQIAHRLQQRRIPHRRRRHPSCQCERTCSRSPSRPARVLSPAKQFREKQHYCYARTRKEGLQICRVSAPLPLTLNFRGLGVKTSLARFTGNNWRISTYIHTFCWVLIIFKQHPYKCVHKGVYMGLSLVRYSILCAYVVFKTARA